MKKYLLILWMIFYALTFPSQKAKPKEELPEVYFTKEISSEAILRIYEKIKDEVKGKVGIKIHFGEEGNKNFLPPELIKDLSLMLDATLIETNVMYRSKRNKTETHIQLAKEHGFIFSPIDILDSGGIKEIPVKNMKYFKNLKVGSNIDRYDTVIVYSHFKGHGSAGFGGAIKNIAMGLAAPDGKRAMHSSYHPDYENEKCIKCRECVRNCPVDAITLDPLVIDYSKCIGCGKCITVCPVKAINTPSRQQQQIIFLEKLVEYAKGIQDTKKMVYINVLANISRSCDCARNAPPPFMEDVGILASTDLVAIENASHNLVDKVYGSDDTFKCVNSVSGKRQIEYAEELGMGKQKYILINID